MGLKLFIVLPESFVLLAIVNGIGISVQGFRGHPAISSDPQDGLEGVVEKQADLRGQVPGGEKYNKSGGQKREKKIRI